MALADYFGRGALAASQVLSGFDETRIRETLADVRVGISVSADAVDRAEGRALVDLLVRLLARFYPRLVINVDGSVTAATAARELAQRINPSIEFVGAPTIEVIIGSPTALSAAPVRIFVGSSGWRATVSSTSYQTVGETDNPFGAGAAACIAAANVFRAIFLDTPDLDQSASFSFIQVQEGEDPPVGGAFGEVVMVGTGAIGNGAAWALSRTPMTGVAHLVDHEAVDLGNLQRYVLTERTDEGATKVDVARRAFLSGIRAQPHRQAFADFVGERGYQWPRMLLALDSARDRRAAQASLPRWVANAWTQPGDLGMSTHDFLNGACVACLYLPQRSLENEDALIAHALGVPERLMEVRVLLYGNGGVTRQLLEAIATAGQLPVERLLPFENRPIRSLYTEGFCGGAVIPMGRAGTPRSDVHVPLAHQSAFAGVLLAAAAVSRALGHQGAGTLVTRLNLLRRIPQHHTQTAAKDARGICLCQDLDYRAVYAQKYDQSPP